MAFYNIGLLWVMCFVLLVPTVSPQNVVTVPENTKDVLLFTQTFVLPSTTCGIVKVTEIPHSNGQLLLNWTSPVQSSDGQYSTDVSLTKPLDYEQVTVVIVQLKVTFTCDVGGEQIVDLPQWRISVEDELDSKPDFIESSYEANIPENLPVNSTIIDNIAAKDPDRGDSIRYSLEMPDKDRAMFIGVSKLSMIDGKLQQVFEIRLTQTLDHETEARYKFKVIVMDSKNYSSDCDVTIYVEDVQDVPPTFTLPVYSGRVDEMAPEGTSVTKVEAIDGDGEYIRNKVSYTIVSGLSNVFGVDNATGTIFTKRQLDTDGDNVMGFNGLVILTVKAEELNTSGEVQYGETTATTQIQIQIDDANDHAPTFGSPSYSGSIRREAQAGEIVALGGNGYISVTDQDQSPSNNHFSLQVERDGVPWAAFAPNVNSQFVQASVLIVLNDPEVLKGMENTHIKFQLVARDLSSDASLRRNSNTSTVADISVFVLPQASTVPPPEAIVDLPISTSDVIVFVMGFLLVLNIILTVIICRLMHRNGKGGGLGLFRRNSKYYVSKIKSQDSGGVTRINELPNKPAHEPIQAQVAASSSTAHNKSIDNLASTEAAINRNAGVRNTVSSAANRNRCDVVLLHEADKGHNATTSLNSVDEATNQSNGHLSNNRNKTDRCDVAPLARQNILDRSQGQNFQPESGGLTTTPKSPSNPKDRSDKCDLVPLETSLASKNKALSNLLERVQQKLTPSGKGHSDTCDLRPLHEDNPSPDASMTEATNSNNSSFSEKTKCDVAPLIRAAGIPKPDKQVKTVSPSEVNVAFTLEDTEAKTLKASDRRKNVPQNGEMKSKISNDDSTHKKVKLVSVDDNNGPVVPQYIPTLSPSQSQITQTGVPPVALALPFGSSTKPKPMDEPGGLETAVINPVYREDIITKPDMAVTKVVKINSDKSGLVSSGPQTKKTKPAHADMHSNKNGDHKATESSSDSVTQPKNYVEAAKSLLNSATLKRNSEFE